MISAKRMRVLVICIALALAVATLRAFHVQIVEGPRYAAAAREQQVETKLVRGPRGAIFDRAGHLLAISQRAYIVRVNPRTITDTATVAAALSPILGQPADQVRWRIEAILTGQGTLTATLGTVVAYNVTPQAARQLTETLRQAGRDGLTLTETWARWYPQGPIAGPTLGFINLEDAAYGGIEAYYDSYLRSSIGSRQARSRLDLITITPTQQGADLVMTLDLQLQQYVEQRLAQATQETGAKRGTIIVMETASGAILATASRLGYDPNRGLELASSGEQHLLRDPAVNEAYEPGSVLKPLTIAAALDAGLVTTQTILTDTGRLVISNKLIRNAEAVAYGRVTLEDILAHSLNVPTAQIALDLGAETFYRYFRRFGFGHSVGIDLSGEAVGVMRTPIDPAWSRADLATNSYGQGLSATPYQVINALNVIANDGALMQPYLVQQLRMPNGEVIQRRPVQVAQVISKETARTMRKLMAAATRRAVPGTLPRGYTVAGKTGTADWYKDGRKQDTTIVTYVGFLPAHQPQITILVKLDQPQTSRWAAHTAAPVFRDVAEYACRVLGIPPDSLLNS
jgi:cell division protein FtsI/penicillin-binding protein 2